MNQENLRLYEIFIKEEYHYLSEHQRRFSFFIKLMSSITLLTLYALFYLNSLAAHLILLLGPISVIFISISARDGCFRFYQRFLEAVSMRAKIEYKLGMMKGKTKNGIWLEKDPLVVPRNIGFREKAESTQDFIEKAKNAGYHKRVLRLLTLSTIIGCLLFSFCLLFVLSDFKLITLPDNFWYLSNHNSNISKSKAFIAQPPGCTPPYTTFTLKHTMKRDNKYLHYQAAEGFTMACDNCCFKTYMDLNAIISIEELGACASHPSWIVVKIIHY